MTEECDYLVMGCGAQAMAFVDVMLRETDATFVMADRRAAPGGHWNDAYPFVRLHQPSACYGVPSRELGRGTKDKTGFNKGLLDLAPGIKVANYFHEVMADVFLPTGRVSYFPLSEVTPDRDMSGPDIKFELYQEKMPRDKLKKKEREAIAVRLEAFIKSNEKDAPVATELAKTMTKVVISQNNGQAPFWHVINFLGPGKCEPRGIVDLLAIRKNHLVPSTELMCEESSSEVTARSGHPPGARGGVSNGANGTPCTPPRTPGRPPVIRSGIFGGLPIPGADGCTAGKSLSGPRFIGAMRPALALLSIGAMTPVSILGGPQHTLCAPMMPPFT